MGKINVDELKPGMVLAADLFGPNERFLLARGTVLEKKHLQILKAWGATEADIENVSPSEIEEQAYTRFDPDIIERSRQIVGRRFVHADLEHEAVAELYRLVVLRTAEQLQKNPASPDADGGEQRAVPARPEKLPSALKISAVISDHVQFSSLPDTFYKITEAINNPRSSSAYIAGVIGADISLSTKLLRLVNSAFFGLPQKIDSLAQAVTVVGTRQLANLAMGVSIITQFNKISTSVLDMRSFWEHCLCCGVIARLIAALDRARNEEAFFVSGLLHDIGRLLLLQNFPDYVLEVLARAGREKVMPHAVESEVWGLDHAKIAGRLFEKWKFPPSLESAVKFHHAPWDAQSRIEPSIIHVADIITHAMDYGKSTNPYVPPLDASAWEALKMPKSTLSPIMTQTDYQLSKIFDIFMP